MIDRACLDLPFVSSEPQALEAAARDAGGIVSLRPCAVARPRSVDDVVSLVRACRGQGLTLAARGSGHTTFGQSQTENGVVVDMTSLNRIDRIGDDRAVVDAGVTWRNLLYATTARGLRPPVLTGFQGLTVGGTLSVGGISGVSYAKGAQIDHVLEIDVVTGEGRVVTCSDEKNPDLFNAALGGRGGCGIIARATVPLVSAPARVRLTVLSYARWEPFLRGMRALVHAARLDGVSGTIVLLPGGGIRYDLNTIRFDPPPGRAHGDPLDGVGAGAAFDATDFDYLEYCLLVDTLIEGLESAAGWEGVCHPWLDVFLADGHVEEFVRGTLATLDPGIDTGPPELASLGQVHLFPLRTEHLTRPLLQVPGGDVVYLFDILTAARGPGPSSDYAARMIQRNRELLDRARVGGATPYAITATPLTREDWQEGPLTTFEHQRRRHDPDGVFKNPFPPASRSPATGMETSVRTGVERPSSPS